MKGADGWVQGYNAQAAVEPTLLLIVGQGLTQAANDKQQLQPMVKAITQQAQQRPAAILADSGYCSEENLQYLESDDAPKNKIDGYVATGKSKHGQHRQPCPRGPLPKDATRTAKMKRRLQTKVGKAVYAARKTIVEPVSARSNKPAGSASFCCEGLKNWQADGHWSVSRTTFCAFTRSAMNKLSPNPITRRHSRGRERPSKTIRHLVANREVTFSLRHI